MWSTTCQGMVKPSRVAACLVDVDHVAADRVADWVLSRRHEPEEARDHLLERRYEHGTSAEQRHEHATSTEQRSRDSPEFDRRSRAPPHTAPARTRARSQGAISITIACPVVRTIACPVVRAAASSTRDDSERYVVNCGWATGTSSRCARAKATIEAMKARSLPFLSPQGSITGGRISIARGLDHRRSHQHRSGATFGWSQGVHTSWRGRPTCSTRVYTLSVRRVR
jgi:hypothetical protein